MKNRLFYFAACVALVLSSVSCSSDDGEEEDADIPVVGKIAVSGAYNVYSHGSQGWIEADKIGIYVLSAGKLAVCSVGSSGGYYYRIGW